MGEAAERAQRQASAAAERAGREEERAAERAAREAERAQDRVARAAERAAREEARAHERAARETARAQQQAAREAKRAQRQIASAAERAARDEARAHQKAAREAARAQERAGRDIERAQRRAARAAERAARDIERAHRRAARDAQREHEATARSVSQTGMNIGNIFGRLLTGRLRSGLEGAREVLDGFFRNSALKAAESAESIGASFATAAASGTAMTAATGGINLLIGAILAAAAAAAVLVTALLTLAPVLYLIGGAAGASTTALVGLIGMIGVLKLGLGGIGDAWTEYSNQAASGGASSAGAARAVAQAQREVRNATYDLGEAQRRYLQTQRNVNQAIQDEIEARDDLNRSLAGAKEDQVGALLAVQRAQERLNQTIRDRRANTATDLDVSEAEHNLRQAQLAVVDMQDRVEDLTKEQQKNSEVGVHGSQRVRDALDQQRQAAHAVELAQQRLTAAQESLGQSAGGAAGGVDKFAEAMAKLSPNAQALVKAFIDLKPRFDELKRSVQDRLLAGYADQVKELSTKWLPSLHIMLGGLADTFNNIGSRIMTAMGQKRFIDNISDAMKGFGEGVAISMRHVDKFIDAIGRLAQSSVPFFRMLGELIDDMLNKFSDWIIEADKTGKLDEFMKNAAKSTRDLFDIIGLTILILGDFTEILFPTSKSVGGGFFDGVKKALDDLHKKLSDPEVQKKVRDWLRNAKEAVKDFLEKLNEWAHRIDDWATKIDGWIATARKWAHRIEFVADLLTTTPGEIAQAWDQLRSRGSRIWSSISSSVSGAVSSARSRAIREINRMVSDVRSMPGRIRSAAQGMWNGIRDEFRAAMNWIIDHWNRLHFRTPTVDFLGMHFGGADVGVPQIKRFAQGGIASGLVEVGERGRELVQLPSGSRVYPTANPAGPGGGPVEVRVVLDVRGGDDNLLRWLRQVVKNRGNGSVQVALGGR
jgi:hypothetical protein